MKFLEFFEITNRLRRLNRIFQVALILSLLAGINFISLNHFSRWDLTESNRFALSAETKGYIEQLDAPVDVIVTLSDEALDTSNTALYRYLKTLLREYVLAGQADGRSMIRVEYVDLWRDRVRARELAEEFGLESADTILVTYQNRRRSLRSSDMMRFIDGEPVAYTGEAAITSAIVEVNQEAAPVIYFLQGHGETSFSDTHPQTGLSAMHKAFRSKNMEVRFLDLSSLENVPEDAGVLVIAHPKGRISTSEVEKIRRYLSERSGRVIIWLGPESPSGLESLMPQWGIFLPEETIIEQDPAYLDSGQSVLVRNLAEHPITAPLLESRTSLLLNDGRPVLPVRPTPWDERLTTTPLFATSANSWAEKRPAPANASFDPLLDRKGPVPVAIASERQAARQLGIDIPGGKLVVIGSPSVFSNRYLQHLGNANLLFSTLNWMLERNRLIAIPPKEIVAYQLQFSESELRNIGLFFLLVPISVAALGVIVYWIRKY